jgi:hypothetical protein
VVWRDKAAMEAGADEQMAQRKVSQARTGGTVTSTDIYENFVEL